LIQAVDRDLRDRHGPALAGLLALAPGAPLRPAAVADLIDALAAGEPTPAVQLPPADIELPLTADALHTILSNLLRNALAAVRGAPHPQIMVRVDQARDATGRLMVALLVADSAAPTVTLQEIDRRDGQRGLGLVRDLVRRWGGHLVVNPQPPPFVKAIGASFPVASSKGAPP
jgi:signal transduction histidine kinase